MKNDIGITSEWVEKLLSGEAGLHALPEEWSEDERAAVRLKAVTENSGKPELRNRIVKNGVVEAAAGRNCEQMVGELTIPLGVAGPLMLKEDFPFSGYVPLATTEGALVASVQRGMKVINLAGGAQVQVRHRGVTRAPVFRVKNGSEGKAVMEWLNSQEEELGKVAARTSSHIRLMKIEVELVGKSLFVRFRFDTGEAMGMNMVTVAAKEMADLIVSKTGIELIALSGNACVDKKASWSNALLGRGLWVQAEVEIPGKLVVERLKTSAEQLVEVVLRKDWLGSIVSGSLGFNSHFANMVAALSLATGQDLAHVVEGSLGVTTAEMVGEDLYFSVTMPSVMVGTVGGGTRLPVQLACLELMGLGKGIKGEKLRLGAILGGTVLAGELSLAAALASNQLAQAHERLGRKRE